MVEQNLSVSRTISNELMMRALILGLEQITQYGEMYREAINLFKNKHFEDRSQVFASQYLTILLFLLSSCFVSLFRDLLTYLYFSGALLYTLHDCNYQQLLACHGAFSTNEN
jgi:hypothetical protein